MVLIGGHHTVLGLPGGTGGILGGLRVNGGHHNMTSGVTVGDTVPAGVAIEL